MFYFINTNFQLLIICPFSDFDSTNKIQLSTFPTLFPGGIGDLYNEKRGEMKNDTEWANHLLRFFDGRFECHKIWSLYTVNWMTRRNTNKMGGFFLQKFLGSTPPTAEELKERIKNGDTSFISKLQHFSSSIRGSPSFWRQQRQHLLTWMNYHAEQQNGPPTLFLTFSCAENHWSDLADILAGRVRVYDTVLADKVDERDFTAMSQAARDHPLVVAEYFQKRLEAWLDTVGKRVFKIKHYWGAYEFAKGRGVIHIHLLAIADNMSIMRKYYELRNDKAAQLEHISDYARKQLFMTAEHPSDGNKKDIAAPEGTALKEEYMQSLKSSYSGCISVDTDCKNLINSCGMHFCGEYCLRKPVKTRKVDQTCHCCRFGFGTESKAGNEDTAGKEFTDCDKITIDSNGIKRLELKRSGSKRMNQLSTIQLQSWRANCDVQLLLYDSDPYNPDLSEFIKVVDYVVSYITKGNIGYLTEQKIMKGMIEK